MPSMDYQPAHTPLGESHGALSASGIDELGLTPRIEPTLNSTLVGGEAQELLRVPATTVSQASLPTLEIGSMSHGAALAVAPAAGEPISPLVQLIMRLPGALGLTSSFFEALANLFVPGGHNLVPGVDASVLGAHIGSHAQTVFHFNGLPLAGSDHIPINLSLLPTHAPIFTFIGGKNLGNLSGLGQVSQVGSSDSLNISGHLDWKKPQFEGIKPSRELLAAQTPNACHEGVVSGPEMSDSINSTHLSGSQKFFSDQITTLKSSSLSQGLSASAGSTLGQNLTPGVAVGLTQVSQMPSSLNVGVNSFGQEVGGSDVVVNNSVPAQETTTFAQDNGELQASANTRTLDQQLISYEPGAYQPTMGGYYDPGKQLGLGQSALNDPSNSSLGNGQGTAGTTNITPLRAKELSLDAFKKMKAGNLQAKSVQDHIGYQSKSFHNSAGYQAKAIDQIAHRYLPKVEYQRGPSLGNKPQMPGSSYQTLSTTQATANHQELNMAQSDFTTGQKPNIVLSDATDGKLLNQAYTIKRGDCLWNIAKNHLGNATRWQEIYKLNADVLGDNPNLIYAGTTVKMPGFAVSQAASDGGKYVVQAGDNLWDIAKQHLGDGQKWGDLYKVNIETVGANPRLIYPGQELNLSGGEQVQTLTSTPSTQPLSAIDKPQALGCANLPAAEGGLIETRSAINVGADAAYAANGQNVITQGASSQAISSQTTLTSSSPVSPSLAPDLSFLSRKPLNK